MTLRERIKALCKENNISMNKLEMKCGFARGYLSKLDKSTPNSENIQKLANYFNVSVDYLMTGEEAFDKYSDEVAHLAAKIRNDIELAKALQKYFNLPDVKKKHVVELINMLGDD